jgi:hypothetical protein
VLVHRPVLELLDRGEPGLDRDRVPVVRPSEVDVAGGVRRQPLHQLAPAGDRGEREAVRDRLPQRREVGRHAAHLLVSAEPVAEAGDDLVEDQHDALAVAERPEALEEAVLRQQARGVVGDRLDDDRRHLPVARGALDVLEVVEPAHQRGVDGRVEHPLGLRVAAPDEVG